MSEPKKVDHWAFLASELGADVPEPEISEEFLPFTSETPVVEEPQPECVTPTIEETHVEEPIVAEQIEEVPVVPVASPSRSERPRSSWDLLANELGIEVPPEPEPEPISEPTAATPSPVVERAAAERMFESLFSPQEPESKVEEKAFPAREERTAGREPPRSGSRREEPRRGGREETSRHGGREEEPRRGGRVEESRHGGREEELRRGGREETSRHGDREEEPRRGGRVEESRRGGRVEEPRRGSKSEPLELFLDEDVEAEEELEIAFAPAEETADPEEKKKRRRRRRGRKDRDAEPEQSKPEKPIIGKAKALAEDSEENDEFSFFDEPEEQLPRSVKDEPEEEEGESRPGKRRRSRRGARKSKKPAAESAAEKKPPAKAVDKFADEDDEFWDDEDEEIESPVGYSRRGGSAKDSAGRARGEIRPAFRSIPTWDEAVGLMVAKNMESRGKRPSGGQGRGGRRDNRR